MNRIKWGVLLALIGSIASAQTTVKADQGKPGNQGPWPVTVVGPIVVTGDGGVVAFQGTVPWVDNVSQWGGVNTTLGQKVMASSVPVVIASDQSPVACYVAMDGGQQITVNQGTTPWIVSNTQVGTASQNVAQFGGSAVVTGVGPSGAGIPRVTVSNDSLINVAVTFDGGVVQTAPVQCGTTQPDGGSVQRVTSVGLVSTQVPATGASTANRYYITICNSPENTGIPNVKCLYNNVAPVIGVANAGDVLGVNDCWRFDIPGTNQLRCISNKAGTAVTSNECVP